MDVLTRQEYPAMLERLQPDSAVAKLNERIKKIGKVNSEIADWLQERRKIEDAYAASLRKLSRRPIQGVGSDMGGFESPWKKILAAADEIAKSHSILSDRIVSDIEQPLRNFATTNSEMSSIISMQGNISNIAKELADAQEKFDKLNKKGNKANSQKYDAAASRLQAANQQWAAQAPFVFETLQALDERRLKHLQDVLTMYQTHEADQNERNCKSVESTVKSLLEFDSEAEIRSWSQASVDGKTTLKRNLKSVSGFSALPSPTATLSHGDNHSEHSQPSKSESGEKNKLQRIGTIFTRRRQSVQSVFRPVSPTKPGFQSHGRATSSRAGRQIPSPRASSSHLRESDNRLCPLPEISHSPSPSKHEDANTLDVAHSVDLPLRKSSLQSPRHGATSSECLDTSDIDSAPPHAKMAQIDDEGFSVPPAAQDQILQTQVDQPQFKLDIRSEPIPEQESDAEAALSSVANTLRSAQASTPIRKAGTVRGRRDARNMMPAKSDEFLSATPENPLPTSPVSASPVNASKNTTLLPLSSSAEQTALSGSDNFSIRSGQSFTNPSPIGHPELHRPGLNCSIVETITAIFGQEYPQSLTITGEVALSYNPEATNDISTTPSQERIRINKPPCFEILRINRNFVDPTPGKSTDHFTVQLPPITSKSAIAFTYRIQPTSEPSLSSAPLLIRSAWKRQNEKLGLIIEYSLNPTYCSTPTLFSNLILIANYTGACASSCQTKPNGTHLREKLLVYWRLGDVMLDETWHKAIVRFSGANDAVPEPSHIEANWELNDAEKLVSKFGNGISFQKLENTSENAKEPVEGPDPFADETAAPATPTIGAPTVESWKEITTVKKLVSGRYTAKNPVLFDNKKLVDFHLSDHKLK